MDVTLPSGVVIQGVPEGTNKFDVMRKAIAGGVATLDDFYPRPDIKGAENAAVQKVADNFGRESPGMTAMFPGVGELKRGLVGARESLRTAASRIPGLVNEEGQQQAQQERELTGKLGGLSALAGRAAPGAMATAGVPAGYIPQALSGAAQGALTGESPRSGAITGALGGALGNLGGNLLGRGANAVAGKWAQRPVKGSDEAAKYLEKFQDLGGALYPSQAAGGSKIIDQGLANNALTGGSFERMTAHNEKLLTNLASKAVGVNAREIGPETLSKMDGVISKQFNDVADMIDEVPVANVADDIKDLLRKGDVKPYEDALMAGSISGKAYMTLRSKLLAITRGSSDKVKQAWDTIDELDNNVEQVAPEGFKEAYSQARERFKSLLTLEKFKRGITGGQANASTLDSAARDIFGKQYTRDAGTLLPETQDFFDALRAMSSPRMDTLLGGSPTAKRLGSSAIGLTGLAGVMTGNPALTAIAGGATYAGVPMALAAPAAPAFGKFGGKLGGLAPYLSDELARDSR